MGRRKDDVRLDLCFNRETDGDLIAWLASLNGQPYGHKQQTVKAMLRRALSLEVASTVSPANPPTGELKEIQTHIEAIHQRLKQSPALDLGEIRAVVEAAVASSLAKQGGAFIPSNAATSPEEPSLLASMVSGLMLEEDEA